MSRGMGVRGDLSEIMVWSELWISLNVKPQSAAEMTAPLYSSNKFAGYSTRNAIFFKNLGTNPMSYGVVLEISESLFWAPCL